MIKVVCGNNLEKGTVLVNPETTSPKQVMDEISARYGISFARGSMHIDGVRMEPEELEGTFADLGYTNATESTVHLLNVAKADNA